MQAGLAAGIVVVAKHRHPVTPAGCGQRGLQGGDAGAYNRDVFAAGDLYRLPVVFIDFPDPGIVVTFQPGAIDDAAPAGITGHAIADVGLPTLLAFAGKSRVGDQGPAQENHIRRPVGERRLALVRVGQVADGTTGHGRSSLSQCFDMFHVGMPVTVGIGQVLVQ